MTPVVLPLVAFAVVVLVGVATLVAGRVRRLDRLHVRTDAARAGLESALQRRAEAALGLAAALEATGAARTDGLRAAVADARAAGRDREAAENVLGRELAAVPRTGVPDVVLEELVDAEQLVVLARRVHNDAVRDTRELRSRRLVRRLRLAGTAPMPEYFEIADPVAGVTTAAPGRPPVAPPP
ncbi:NUDIX hydrolase [Pseudonocardia zijingensis]|uniref:NUDIX hydrolase n=1 Tax=Pseudonocardia zijingensis TaxID=153376 RepID=UPI003612A9CB